MAESQVNQWLQQGVAAAKAGRREEARRLLMQVVEADERIELAWLWLSSVVDTDADRLVCLENVLTLNPGSEEARAGLEWLQQRGVIDQAPSPAYDDWDESLEPEPDIYPFAEIEPQEPSIAEAMFGAGAGLGQSPLSGQAERTTRAPEADGFLGPDGCVYCGRPVDIEANRCPHCGGALWFSQFSKEKPSATVALAITLCVPLAFLNVSEWFLLGQIWKTGLDRIPSLLVDEAKSLVGPTVYAPDSFDGFVTAAESVKIVQVIHLIMAGLFVLVAIGLFFRLSQAHTLGLVASIFQVAISIGGFFTFGVWGWLPSILRTAFALVLMVFLIQTVEDFARERFRLDLQLDRRLVNAADYYSRGRAYQQQGMWAKALVHWLRATAISPLYDGYHVAVARAYYNLNRYDEALAAISQAIQVSRSPGELEPLRQRILETRQNRAEE